MIYPNVLKALELFNVDVNELSEIIQDTHERANELINSLDDWDALEASSFLQALNSKRLTLDTLFKTG
jgi:hypothetical protein